MVKNKLVGGDLTILKNDGVRQWEGWQPIYEMENKKCSKPPTSKPRDNLQKDHVHTGIIQV